MRVDVQRLGGAALTALYAELTRRWPKLDDTHRAELLDLAFLTETAPLPTIDDDVARAFLLAVIDAAPLVDANARDPVREASKAMRDSRNIRLRAIDALARRGKPADCAALVGRGVAGGVPVDIYVRAALKLSPQEAYVELVDAFRAHARVRALVAIAVDGAAADPRWIDEALAFVHSEPDAAAHMLARLGRDGGRAADELAQLAEGRELDDVTVQALLALGDRGAARIVDWLERPAGRAHPLHDDLVHVVATRGSGALLPRLRALLVHFDEPDERARYEVAIRMLELRHAP